MDLALEVDFEVGEGDGLAFPVDFGAGDGEVLAFALDFGDGEGDGVAFGASFSAATLAVAREAHCWASLFSGFEQ